MKSIPYMKNHSVYGNSYPILGPEMLAICAVT